VSVKSVLHKLIDDVHGGSGRIATNLELHQEVDEKDDPKPDVPNAEKEGE
jgi:hypothetical protein